MTKLAQADYLARKPDIGPGMAEVVKLKEERDRFRAGLQIIIDAGAIHGGAWCVAQARGYLEDLDFDQYPNTGKSPS